MIQEANLIWQYKDTECLGLVMPWYTLPALEWLKSQDTKNWKVFEFGTGYSTIWWLLNCRDLRGVESNKEWANAIGSYFINNKESYVNASGGDSGEYNCIIVDGIDREECVRNCLDNIRSGGFLIIDNFESENYDASQTDELLKDWPVVLHHQPNHSVWVTAIFTKP